MEVKKKRPIYTFIFLATLLIGLFLLTLNNRTKDSSIKKISIITSQTKNLKESKNQNNPNDIGKELANNNLPKNALELSKKITRIELELIKETSRLGQNQKLVDLFIRKSKNAKNNKELIAIAKDIGKDDFVLQLQFVKYANLKFPPPPAERKPSQGKPISSDHLFKKLKKDK